MDSCPEQRPRRDPWRVKFNKEYQDILEEHGIDCPPESRNPKNLHVGLDDLDQALALVEPHVLERSQMSRRT